MSLFNRLFGGGRPSGRRPATPQISPQNPRPFTKSELDRCAFSGFKEKSCPECGDRLSIPHLGLVKDLIGEATTIVDGRVVNGVLVCCGTCCRYWKAKAIERVRPTEYVWDPLGEVILEPAELKCDSQVEAFPFGCPKCKTAKIIHVRLPRSLSGAGEYGRIRIQFNCPACSTEWDLSYGPAGLSWDNRDHSYTKIEDCGKCGSRKSLYLWAGGRLRSSHCRACGTEDFNEID